jgi:hypothetical protein
MHYVVVGASIPAVTIERRGRRLPQRAWVEGLMAMRGSPVKDRAGMAVGHAAAPGFNRAVFVLVVCGSGVSGNRQRSHGMDSLGR